MDPAELELRTLGGSRICDAVRTGAVDLGVAVLDLVPPELDARELLTTPMVAASAPGPPPRSAETPITTGPTTTARRAGADGEEAPARAARSRRGCAR